MIDDEFDDEVGTTIEYFVAELTFYSQDLMTIAEKVAKAGKVSFANKHELKFMFRSIKEMLEDLEIAEDLEAFFKA